jgi:VanZ family protein
MTVIFGMSTGTFSAENTSLIIKPLIRFLSPSSTHEEVAVIHGVIRKLAHVTEYFILGLLLFRAFRGGAKGKLRGEWALYSILVVVLCAAADEFHQSFVSTRTASLLDVALDTLGGILAQGVCVLRQLGRH